MISFKYMYFVPFVTFLFSLSVPLFLETIYDSKMYALSGSRAEEWENDAGFGMKRQSPDEINGRRKNDPLIEDFLHFPLTRRQWPSSPNSRYACVPREREGSAKPSLSFACSIDFKEVSLLCSAGFSSHTPAFAIHACARSRVLAFVEKQKHVLGRSFHLRRAHRDDFRFLS